MKVGDNVVMVAFGAGFTSGAIALQWTADPSRGALAETVGPDAVTIRPPVDWSSADPIPPALAALMGSPIAGANLELDNVVPGEPAHTSRAAAGGNDGTGEGSHEGSADGRGDGRGEGRQEEVHA